MKKQDGLIGTPELLLVIVVVCIGLIVGLTILRDSTVTELSDTSEAFGALDQSHQINGIQNSQSSGAIAFLGWSDSGDTNAGDDVGWSFSDSNLSGEGIVSGGGDASGPGGVVAAAAVAVSTCVGDSADTGTDLSGQFDNNPVVGACIGDCYGGLSSSVDITIDGFNSITQLLASGPGTHNIDITLQITGQNRVTSGDFFGDFPTAAERTYSYSGPATFQDLGGVLRADLPDTSPPGSSPLAGVRIEAQSFGGGFFQWYFERPNSTGYTNGGGIQAPAGTGCF